MEQRRNILGILGAALIVIGTFLPWFTAFGVTTSGIGGAGSTAGVFVLVLGVLLALLSLASRRWAAFTGVALGALTALWAVKQISDVASFGDQAGTGIGLYAILIGGVLGAVGSLLGAIRRRSEPLPV